MSILVLMSDNRQLCNSITDAQNFWSYTAYINKKYCDKYGYDFKYVTPYYKTNTFDLYSCIDVNTGQLRHSAYAKIAAVRANIEKYSYVVYIDTDCVFKNFSISLESIISKYSDKNIIFQSNFPFHTPLPCSGFFIVKNTPEQIAVLDIWYKYEIPDNSSPEWQQVMDYAVTLCNYRFHPGKHWEQDVLWTLIITKQITVSVMEDEPAFKESSGQYIRHLCNSIEGHLRNSYFLEIVRNLFKDDILDFKKIIDSINYSTLDTSTIYDITS